MRYAKLLLRIGGLCLRRPGAIPPAILAAWRFRARDWYRRPPFVPLPSRRYLAWRLETAYGTAAAVPPTAELERYLRWSRAAARAGRTRG